MRPLSEPSAEKTATPDRVGDVDAIACHGNIGGSPTTLWFIAGGARANPLDEPAACAEDEDLARANVGDIHVSVRP